MSQTLDQIYIANPSTTMLSTDLMYLVHSPYTPATDSAITYANLASTVTSNSVLLSPAGAQTIVNYGLTVPSLTLGTPLTVANGGTAVTSVTTTPTATAFAGWDANKNMQANSFCQGLSTIAISGGSSSITVATGSYIVLTGTFGDIVLPNATTLYNGQIYFFNNNASGLVSIKDNGGSTVCTLLPGGFVSLDLLSNASSNGSWDFHYTLPSNAAWGTAGLAVTGFITATGNISATNLLPGYATTATAAATTTLTYLSKNQQYFTGSTTQTVVLPLTSTLSLGESFYIVNNSTGVVTVQSSGANTIQAMAAGTTLLVTCILTSGTDAASWNARYLNQAGGSVTAGTINQLAYYAANGNVVSGLATANSASLVTSSTGVPAYSSTMTNGQLIIGSTSATPTAATLTAGTNISITNGAGSITVSTTAALSSAFTTLTDASTVAVNLALSNNFYLTLGGNRTLGVPTNAIAGQSGVINVRQDITGSRTLAYSWPYMFVGGAAPVLSTGKLVFDQLMYIVNSYATATVTVTIATPAVMTWTAHGMVSGQRIQLATTGALPTGLTAATTYWVTVIDANTFNLSTSLANAQAATFIATSGSQSGVQTATNFSITLTINPAVA